MRYKTFRDFVVDEQANMFPIMSSPDIYSRFAQALVIDI